MVIYYCYIYRFESLRIDGYDDLASGKQSNCALLFVQQGREKIGTSKIISRFLLGDATSVESTFLCNITNLCVNLQLE